MLCELDVNEGWTVTHHQGSGVCVYWGRCSYRLVIHMHTDLPDITDAGFKAFSAAVGSSSSIATVKLNCKHIYKWFICSECVHALVHMFECSVGTMWMGKDVRVVCVYVCVCVCMCVCRVSGALCTARVDCQYTCTGLCNITDAGFTAFSTVLGSSSTITSVSLVGTYECLVCWSMCEWFFLRA